MNFKALAASAFAATSIGFAMPEAQAATSYCYQTTRNATVCILSVQTHKTTPNWKLVRWNANGGNVYMDEVYCGNASRYNYQRNMAGIACFEFN
jgi:hypothetical protein